MQTRICFHNTSGVDVKKLAHRLETNASQLVSEAIAEYYQKHGRRYPEVIVEAS